MTRQARPPGAAPQPPEDHVGRLIAGWRAERPDLPVDPVAVVYRITRLAAHLAAEVDKVFARSGTSNADFAVLANLRRAGRPYRLSQRQLMDLLRLTSGTISVRIDRLAERGLVRRDPDPGDGRGVLVTLTEHGERLFDAVAPEHLANEARLVCALDPGQQAELARLLQILLIEFEGVVGPRADERLGLTVAPAHVGRQRRAAVGMPPATGLLVEHVHPGGPASTVGLRPGDLLVRGAELELRSLTDLTHTVANSADAVSVLVRRGNRTLALEIPLPSDPQ